MKGYGAVHEHNAPAAHNPRCMLQQVLAISGVEEDGQTVQQVSQHTEDEGPVVKPGHVLALPLAITQNITTLSHTSLHWESHTIPHLQALSPPPPPTLVIIHNIT